MKVDDFINGLFKAYNSPNSYLKGCLGSYYNGIWYFDSASLVKAILWGWNGDVLQKYGGAKYKARGISNLCANSLIKKCLKLTSDFHNIQVGELVWMPSHVGVYIGNGQVIECANEWGKKGILITNISLDGSRYFRGEKSPFSWQKHGFLPYVEYFDLEAGYYEFISDALLRCNLYNANNFALYKNFSIKDKKLLKSSHINAVIKKGSSVYINKIIYDDGKIFGKFSNSYVLLKNKNMKIYAKYLGKKKLD